MNDLIVKFIGEKYKIPKDVLTYIDLLDFTDNVQKQLASAFVRKLNHEIKQGNVGCLDDKDLSAEIEQQVGKFIARLCDNGIFTRTIGDYLKDNKGYQLYSDVNKAALEKMKSLLIQEMDSWQAGFEDAMQKRDSHITGMGFSIWSGSFVNHAIYAAMEASTINKQEKEAVAQYQKDMADLRSRLDSKYGGEKSNYINNTYIPNMEAALTVFAYDLLDKYVADLIANDKFDGETLEFVDIGRSNDLLKNLTLSNNKKAILENAFTACPYNIAVYMQAMKYDLLDYDFFQTAKKFKQDDAILSFLKSNWGEASYPTKFNIDYHCVDMLSLFTERNSTDILRLRTEQYANGIVKAYSRVADMLDNKEFCHKIIRGFDDNSILAGNAISKSKALSYVDSIVTPIIWNQLVDKCGQVDLLERIKVFIPDDLQVHTKKDIDDYFVKRLTSNFEEARQDLIVKINAKREEDEQRRIEQEKQKAKQERIRQEKITKRKNVLKKGAKISAVVVAVITVLFIVFSLVSLFVNKVIVPANRYKDAGALMDSGDWLKARDILMSLDAYKDSEELIKQCDDRIVDDKYKCAIQLMNEEKYEDAVRSFKGLTGYKDSDDLLEECKHNILRRVYDDTIVQLILNEDYEKAYSEVSRNGTAEQLSYFKLVYTKSTYSDEYYESESEYTYDIRGNLLKGIETYSDGKNKIKEYTYDSQNRLIKERITESWKPSYFFETIYEYNSQGNLIKEATTYDLGKGTTSSYVYNYEYNSEGYLTKKRYKEFDEYGETVWNYENDSKGRIIKEINDDDTYTYYEYDSNDNLIKEVYVWSDGHESVTEYQYSSNGCLTKEFRGYADFEHTYDSKGCLIKTVEIEDEIITATTEYSHYITLFSFPGI